MRAHHARATPSSSQQLRMSDAPVAQSARSMLLERPTVRTRMFSSGTSSAAAALLWIRSLRNTGSLEKYRRYSQCAADRRGRAAVSIRIIAPCLPC